jgi:predicted SnoaL-like aldol condensation-catalyzing enzyme
MNMIKIIFLLLTTATLTTTSDFLHHQSINTNKPVMNNKEKAAFVNKAVQAGDTTGIAAIVREDYIQHTPVVADGLSGLLGLIEKIKQKQLPAPVIRNVRVFEDGNFVVLHHDVHWPNRKAMFEIFRFQDGLAAEHWSGIAEQPEKTANGHTMIDGATTITDRDRTAQNKALVRSFVETILIKGQFDKILDFYHPDIIQHNPYIDNTVPGLVNGIKELAANGISIQIETIKQVLGEGNFVLVFSEGKFAGKKTAFFDLFRVEKGIIVEHWDVLQEVPEKMAHNNGMF